MATRTQPLHRLAIRTPKGELWEPACRFILSPLLAVRVAVHLREYLAGNPAAQEGAPRWAARIRRAIRGDGEEPSACSVEVHRGQPGKWRKTKLAFVPRRGRRRS